MADIKVRIQVNPNVESEIIGDVINNLGQEQISNVSVKTDNENVYTKIPIEESMTKGINGLSLGRDLVFDSDGFLDNQDLKGAVLEDENNPNEFVWGFVPSNGEYSVKLTFTNAQNLKDIIVYGDSVVKQFPTRAIIDGTREIYSDDNRWAINLKEESDTHTIEFTHWNRPNYNACLTLINVMLEYYNVDKLNGLKSIESLSQSTGQPKQIFYGVVPSTGSLEIIDVDGEILEMVMSDVISNSNLKVEILCDNKKIQEHITTDSDYNITNSIFTSDLDNELSQWKNINYAGYIYNNKSESAYYLLHDVLSSIGYSTADIDEMLDENIIYGNNNEFGTIKSYLERINIKYAFLYADNIKSTIDKFCQLAQLQVYKNDNGKIKFVSARPIASTSQKNDAIIVPKKCLQQAFSKSIILKNKYKAVELQEKKVTDVIDFNSVVASFKTMNVTNETSVYDSAKDTFNNSINNTKYELTVSLKIYFTSLSYTFKGNTLDNFEQVLNVIEENSKYYLTYDDDSSGDISDFSFTYTYDPSDSNAGGPYTATAKVEDLSTIGNKGTITYNKETNEYTVNFIVPTKIEKQASFLGSLVSSLPVVVYSEIRSAKEIEISIYGNKRVISFDDVSVSDSNVNEVDTFASINHSELLQEETLFDDIKMSDIIKNNIKSDYEKGISTASTSIACINMFNSNGKKVKDWNNNKDIVKTTELIKVDGDNSVWRVTGRNFRKIGVPLLDLELQEVK